MKIRIFSQETREVTACAFCPAFLFHKGEVICLRGSAKIAEVINTSFETALDCPLPIKE